VLVSEGFELAILDQLQASAEAEGAVVELIGPHIGEVKSNSGVAITPNHAIAAAPSVLFDTVVITVSATEIDTLKKQAAVLNFIRDAYAHLKIIGWTAASMPLLEIAGVHLDDGVVEVDASEGTIAYLDAAKKGRIWPRAAAIQA
jgi:catalase